MSNVGKSSYSSIPKNYMQVREGKRKRGERKFRRRLYFSQREMKHFHVVVVQWRQRNVQKSVMLLQICFLVSAFFKYSLPLPSSDLKVLTRRDFRQLLIFFSILKLLFTFFAIFIGFRKQCQLNSVGSERKIQTNNPWLVPRPHYSARPKRFIKWSNRSELTERDWENAVQETNKPWGRIYVSSVLSRSIIPLQSKKVGWLLSWLL